MRSRYFFISLLGLSLMFFLSCTSADNSSPAERERNNYEQTKNELLKKEQKKPVMFLTISGNKKKNLVGQTVVKGKITNVARVAVFKDVRIKLDFFSKTKALLESDNETIYIELKPGQSEDFKTKYFAPKGTDSVGLSVTGTLVVSQQ